MSAILLSYEQQRRSVEELFQFSSSHLIDIGFHFEQNWSSSSHSISSSSISISSENNSSSSDESDENEPNSLKRKKIREKLKQRDQRNEIDHLLRRKSLQLCRQTSLTIQQEEMQWSQNTTTTTTTTNMSTNRRRDSEPSYKPDPYTLSSSILQISKQLRQNCDKILDKSVPFVIDSGLLWIISESINQVTTNRIPPQETTQEYEDQVLFLSDFFEQTPSLAITLSDSPIPIGSLDMTLFRTLEFLELSKVLPHFVTGLNTLRTKLKKLKCTRCIESLNQLFTISFCAEIISSPGRTLSPISSPALTSVWPELHEIDVSFNRLTQIDSESLSCMPALEILNLSRNRITSIDSSFTRILHTLTVLNLNYNQLTTIPPTPPNLKVLLLSNNYIPTLLSRHQLPNHLEMLDLSQNIVSDDREIESLRHLTSLKSLAFIGNPITYSDQYRKTVASYLSRIVLKSKNFVLDQKKLSSSEIRTVLETIRRPPTQLNPPTYLLTKSASMGTNRDRMNDLKSLTQSMDSSSSSLRSACRKKAKIRELVILDSEISEGQAVVSNCQTATKKPILSRQYCGKSLHLSNRSRSSSSSSSIEEVPLPYISDEQIRITSEAIKSIREKYGEDNWLFRQAGQHVSNLLNMDTTTTISTSTTKFDSSNKKILNLSNSLPLVKDSSSYFYSALSEWEVTTTTSTLTNPQNIDQQFNNNSSLNIPTGNISDESIKPVDQEDSISNTTSSDGLVFYPCHSQSDTSNSLGTSPTLPECIIDTFKDPTNEAIHFKIFENGISLKLIILDNFLYQIDPEKENSILIKWDLKSLKSLIEEKRNEEAESVHFSLSFDTLRKQYREKSFIMPLKDFKLFTEKTNLYLQVRTFQEFGEGFQCTKCQWEFSRAQAHTTVTKGKIPKEIPICPNPLCQSELLIPLEAVPIDIPLNPKNWQPQRTSTPLTGFFGGKSLPLDTGLRESLRKKSLSCLGSPKSSSPSSCNTTNNSQSTKNSHKKEPKSESDIETLSCDSSSIEVLPKPNSSGNDSGSDVVVVEEAIEISLPEIILSTNKNNNMGPPMTDSTSSGSCTGSICTQYEKTLTASSPLAQLLSPLAIHQSTSNMMSLASTSTTILSTQPFRYDYEKFNIVDHRLVLYSELSLFRHPDERLLALIKVMVMTSTGSFMSLVIFSNKKIYFCKIIGIESDKIESWLQNWKNFPLSRLNFLFVLIGRHGLGLDLNGKYFTLIFRDSIRTSNFIEFFLGDSCDEMESRPMVQDFSQTQKALMSPTNPIGYFGILRHAYCGSGQGTDKSYAVCAVVVTSEELILVADLSWLVNRDSQSVSVKHIRQLTKLRQVESFEVDVTFVRLVFELDTIFLNWELAFETESEKIIFLKSLRSHAREVPFIPLSEPRQA